jgi:hypothetical protein
MNARVTSNRRAMVARTAAVCSVWRARNRAASVSSTIEFVMTTCSLAARNRSIKAGSWATIQPIRRPGSPHVFDSDDTLTTFGDRDAATGSGPAKRISRYVSSTSSVTPRSSHSRTTARSSRSSIATPDGLWGVVKLTRRVPGVISAARRSRSSRKPCSNVSSHGAMSTPISDGVSRFVA